MTNPLLFTPITIRGVNTRNRVWVSRVRRYARIEGDPTDRRPVNLGRYTFGGAGIVFTKKTAVEARSRRTHELVLRCAETCVR